MPVLLSTASVGDVTDRKRKSLAHAGDGSRDEILASFTEGWNFRGVIAEANKQENCSRKLR
jgi:hypothetical protein